MTVKARITAIKRNTVKPKDGDRIAQRMRETLGEGFTVEQAQNLPTVIIYDPTGGRSVYTYSEARGFLNVARKNPS